MVSLTFRSYVFFSMCAGRHDRKSNEDLCRNRLFCVLSMFDRLIARPTDTASFIDALGRKIVVGPQMSVFMTSSRYDTMITLGLKGLKEW